MVKIENFLYNYASFKFHSSFFSSSSSSSSSSFLLLLLLLLHLNPVRKVIYSICYLIPLFLLCLGLSARHTAGVWEYSDGSTVDFFNWRHGFPRNVHVLSKNCVIVAGKTMWVNRPCYRVLAQYVCTKPLKSGSRRRRHRRVRT